MNKYKNVGIPFQYYFSDKYVNDKIILTNNDLYKQPVEFVITDLVKIYSEYFYEILPYLIIWRSSTQYYMHRDLEFLLKKCLLSQNIRFIVLKLTLVTSPSSTHANIIIYDKQKNTLERFEPYGIIPYLETNNLDNFIEKIGKQYLNANLKYYSPKDIFGAIGFQTISNDGSHNVKTLGSPIGYCLGWTIWYLEMRVSNPELEPQLVLKNAMEKIINDNVVSGEKSFITFIRNYASQLDKLKNNFMKLAGVNENNIYNLVLSNDDQTKVMKLMASEFSKIIDERY